MPSSALPPSSGTARRSQPAAPRGRPDEVAPQSRRRLPLSRRPHHRRGGTHDERPAAQRERRHLRGFCNSRFLRRFRQRRRRGRRRSRRGGASHEFLPLLNLKGSTIANRVAGKKWEGIPLSQSKIEIVRSLLRAGRGGVVATALGKHLSGLETRSPPEVSLSLLPGDKIADHVSDTTQKGRRRRRRRWLQCR